MKRLSTLASTLLMLALCGALSSCRDDEKEVAAGDAKTPANGGIVEPCIDMPTMSGSPAFMNETLKVTVTTLSGAHLSNDQRLIVIGPFTSPDHYKVIPIPWPATPPHKWPNGGVHQALSAGIANEYCIDTTIDPHDGEAGVPHRFRMRILDDEPLDVCIEQALASRCGDEADAHSAGPDHAGSAHLQL